MTTATAVQIIDRLAELDARQAQLEKRFNEVTGALEAMARDIKGHIDRTRERRFVEAAASRLLPQVYGHMVANSGFDQMIMAKEAVRKAAALWQTIDQHFDARQDND